MQAGWEHWFIPESDQPQNNWHKFIDDEGEEVLLTPNTTRTNPFQQETTEHARTLREYPDGFVITLEFKFDPNQEPVFPAGETTVNRHRPTFLGNSGLSIYNWEKNTNYLYEVQIADTAGMCGGAQNIPHENRFVRLDYGPNWTQKGVLAPIDPTILASEKTFFNPILDAGFVAAIGDGRADNLCAIVAGLPVSYFRDVQLGSGTDIFPRTQIAESSPIPEGPNLPGPLPIGGMESPLDMFYEHRADYVQSDGGGYKHFNKLNSGAWNILNVCFLPARYNAAGEKCLNAYVRSYVNGHKVFEGDLKSGTRSSRRRAGQDPEPEVYVDGKGDFHSRLLGHWGSKVFFRKVVIRSVGSTPGEM